MKIKVNSYKWHTLVLINGIFLLSVLCWIGFAKNITNNILSDNGIPKTDFRWNDHVYKKEVLSKIDSVITYLATGKITSSQVVLGEERWLFYKGKTDSDSIADYEGTNRYSENEMQEIVRTALRTQEIVEKQGSKFVILVPPNKENIYAEYMPDTYHHAEISSTDILIGYLKAGGVNIVSPKKSLLESRLDKQVYYSYDTHWNQLGAYIGVREVLGTWGIEIPELCSREIQTLNLRDNYHYCGEDDLAKMLGLRMVFNDEKEYKVDGTAEIDWEKFADEQTDGVSHFKNYDAMISGEVFLVGDSFRTSMIPALGETFSDVYVVHRNCYEPEMFKEINPDYLIVEYVERYSSDIGEIHSLIQ
ncbi:MAG: hypothetical protein HFH58_01235 [Lachnospiraceae bacterium]|nr:hypothetical protein [Lachnospiraceae bacterium]